MKTLTLPDNTEIQVDEDTSYRDALEGHLGKEVRKALAVKVDDEMLDLSRKVEKGGRIELVNFNTDEGKLLFWHSSAHVLAQAVKRLYPEAKFDDGPALMTGPGHFYYDIYLEKKLTEEDFEDIEKEIQKIVRENHEVSRRVLPKAEAIRHFQNEGEKFKVDIINNLPDDAVISLYRQGEFEDLCRGPHVPSTGRLGAFKLTAISGAYWKGDPENPMLQRIYGVSFPDQKQVKQYFKKLEEAKKRDHRKLGRELDLFHIQQEAPGMVFWHNRGFEIYRTIEGYIRRKLRHNGYHEVRTPQVLDLSLWHRSGHAEKFAENMFITDSEEKQFAIKPMNCPAHVQIYNQGIKSYRDLPLRMAEFGSCHRNEPSGTLHGLMRVRQFVQDDAHIFCTEDQIQNEVADFVKLLFEVYKDFGFNNILIALSTRPEKRVGSDEMWDKAEQTLEEALQNLELEYRLQPGEGAFYGPKIEFSLQDTLDRIWQCGTIQVDFSMPGRLEASFVNAEGEKETPVMLHRAILGSLERFIGILIEHYAGKLPLWLSPVQVSVLSVTESVREYAEQVAARLAAAGIKAVTDTRNEKIGYKIREWNSEKINYAVILGENELNDHSISVRKRGDKQTENKSIDEFIDALTAEINSKVTD